MKKIFYSIIALATVAFSMVSCEDIPSPYNIPEKQSSEKIPPMGDGLTVETAYNVAAIDSLLDAGFSNDDSPSNPYYYIKGIICSRPSITTSYGNATYYISDDGTSNEQFYIYRSLSYNGNKFTSTDDLAYGDTVVVYTQVYSYSGTYETRSGVCKLVSRNGQQKGGGGGSSANPEGDGTLSNPYNVAGIINFTSKLDANASSANKVYFKGIVSSVKECSASYGNATFYISDDGSTTNEFYVYRTLGLNGGKISSATEVETGDTVVIYGNVVNYSGNTPETVSKESYIYSIKKASGGGSTPTSGGTKDDPYTVAQALSVAASLQKSSTSASYLSDEVYVKGKICKITDTALSSYGNITYYISEDGKDSNSLEVYRGFSFNGAKFTSIDDIKVGDEVIVCGKLQNWLGTYEFTSGSKIYSLNGKTSGGGESGGGESGGGSAVSSLTNGDFETWANDLPTGWKSASSASSATLKQSTDAHGGSYSVCVVGNTTSNKRLATQEITLEAGSYTFSFYAKGNTDPSQVRPGYVPVTEGSVGSYSYGNYATITSSWAQYSYSFTLAEKTTLCLIIMNPKKSDYSSGADVLIDDATLVKTSSSKRRVVYRRR